MRVQSAELLQTAGRAEQFPRGGRPEVAFAGRSNVGKSSLINRLLGRRNLAHISSTPGRTRTINFYLVNEAVLFADLPGYGYAKVSRSLQEDWWALVEGYLTYRPPLRGVVHLVDARHPPTDRDQGLQEFLAAVEIPSVVVLTKADKVSRGVRAATQTAAARVLGLTWPIPPLFFSAETGEGALPLWRAIEGLLSGTARRPEDTARTLPRRASAASFRRESD